MEIKPITEESHNTAILTLAAERQELLYHRQMASAFNQKVGELELKIQELEAKLKELEEKNVGDSANV